MTQDSESSRNGASREALPRLRLAKVLRERVEREGSYAKLEKAIRLAISSGGSERTTVEGGARFVDRRKLKQIVDNHPKLVLSIGELRGLDLYLELHGHGLAYNRLFEKTEVLGCIAESGRVAFLLGSKTDRNDPLRGNVSHWDLLGLSRILDGIFRVSQNVQFDIREVRMHETEASARKALSDTALRALFDDNGPSLVVLGSSVGNQMAEWMLCRMAGYPPFEAADSRQRSHPPFQFVWWKERLYALPSRFHLYGEDALRDDRRAGEAVLKQRAACFRYRGGYLIDDLSSDGNRDGDTYALCAVQRRPNGQIWLLVAGLTGPATFAAAKWVNVMSAGLYDRTGSGPSPVYWNLLRASAVRVTSGQQETHQVQVDEVMVTDVAWGS